ncbi:4'-phosphopantetheinyl transferase superfamily protein [Blastococcus montanus]|uniref:4'-phosphopantetheinyl transferase family protein n=1 Tax=Blastococcus montanus TaxID=3144973 RepID=UPI003208538B
MPSPVAGIELWSLDLRSHPCDAARAGLSGDDHARWARLGSCEADRLLARRALLRGIVAAEAGCRVEDVRVPVGAGPRTAETPGGHRRYCSVSSSGGRALVALADVPVGVDLEQAPGPPDGLVVAQHVLPAAEARWIARGGPAAPERFLATWVRKEAVVKCTGEGLHRDLRSFVVDARLPVATVSVDGALPGEMVLADVPVPDGFAALAVAVGWSAEGRIAPGRSGARHDGAMDDPAETSTTGNDVGEVR